MSCSVCLSVSPLDCPSSCLTVCDDCLCTQNLLLYVVLHCGYFYGIFPSVPATREGGVGDAPPGDRRLSQEVQRPSEAQGGFLCRQRGNFTNSVYAVFVAAFQTLYLTTQSGLWCLLVIEKMENSDN